MCTFDHPHVLGLVGVCLDHSSKSPYLVLPFMENGDLRSFLKAKRQVATKSTDSGYPEVTKNGDETAIHNYVIIVDYNYCTDVLTYVGPAILSVGEIMLRNCQRNGLPCVKETSTPRSGCKKLHVRI